MNGNEITQEYVENLVHHLNIIGWPNIDIKDYNTAVNQLAHKVKELEEKIYKATEKNIDKRKRLLKSINYYLLNHPELPEEEKNKIDETIKNTQKDMLMLMEEVIPGFIVNLTKILQEYIIFDYYKRGKRKRDFSIFDGRPGLKVSYGQHSCTPDSTFRKVELIIRDFPGPDTKVLFVGDYDLCSLALRTLAPYEIHMLDLDRDLIRFIESKDMNIVTHSVNLKRGVPEDLQNYFDVIMLDPFWDIKGADMFLNPGCSCLKKHMESRLYVTICPYVMGKNYGLLQKMIFERGLMFLEIIKHFSWYIIAENKSYKKILDLYTEINREDLKNEFLESSLNLPTFFSDMHILGFCET